MKNLQQHLTIKNIIILTVLVVLGTLSSCSSSQKEAKPEQVQQQIQALQTTVQPEIPATVTPVEEKTPAKTEQTAETVMLNPPHGQPFHRCDIPVGSPLNSPAPGTTATTTNTNPPINRNGTSPTVENAARLNNSMGNNPTAPTLANSAAPRLNPPHGQPFHRCDIAVGSPLP